MAQVLRFCKVNIPTFARSYGRYRETHYDTLGILPSATQKEIKAAFFKLSKQMHPDATGKKNDADFIKINEAYSVLGKQSTRNKYDMSLRTPYHAHESSTDVHRNTYDSYDDLRKAYGFPNSQQTYRGKPESNSYFAKIHPLLLCFIVMFVGVTFQLILISFSPVFNARMLLKKSAEIEKESKRRIAIAKSRTPEEKEEFLYSVLSKIEDRDRRDRERLAMVP